MSKYESEFIGVRETARRYKRTRQAVLIWCQRGMFPNAWRLDGNGPWVIPVSDLPNFNPPEIGRPKIETYRTEVK